MNTRGKELMHWCAVYTNRHYVKYEASGTEYKETMGVRPIVFLDTGDEVKPTEWEF